MTRTVMSALALVTLVITIVLLPRAYAGQGAAAGDNSVYLPLIVKASPGGQSPAEYQAALDVLAIVNSARAASGCPALALSSQLTAAAQGHSRDMAQLDFFSHSNPRPGLSSPIDRVLAAGYSGSFAGENIAAGQGSAASVMQTWMGSSGHRGNILNCDATEIGIGYYYESTDIYRHYWTQVFGG